MILLCGALCIAMLCCAFMAFHTTHLLISALWLAGCSAILALLIYLSGAYQVAVIELSVGAGLVTVLFVFAISIAGDETIETHSIIPRPIAIAISLFSIVLLGFMTISALVSLPATTEASFSEIVWQQRGLDMLVQSGLMFAAVVGMMGLLAEAKAPAHEKQAVKAKEPSAAKTLPAKAQEVKA